MRLVSLDLTNFRQHAGTAIRFRPGLTGIIGPNGSGKSTILEGIAWAIYGSSAARGTNETIRFARAGRRARVEVELVFELGGHEHRVIRTLHDAEVFIDGSAAAVATGIAGATVWLESRLGMNRSEFFNTYFTGQKELQFLANMGPAQRARFLNRLLGYERLRRAQDHARDRRSAIRHELDGLRTGQADPIALERAIETASQRLEAVSREAETAESARIEAGTRVVAIQPVWTEAQKRRDRARDYTHATRAAEQELDSATRDRDRTDRELQAIAEAERTLQSLAVQLAALPELVSRNDQLAALRRAAERREILERTDAALTEEIGDAARRIATLEQAPALVRQYADELVRARAAVEQIETGAAALQAEWSGQKQEVATRLASYLDRAQELKDKIRELKRAGPDGICPTCQRPLGTGFDAVIARLEDEYDTVVQDGKWLRQREKQLGRKPADLADAEKRRDVLRTAVEAEAQRLARCEQAVQELWTLANERKKKEERRKELHRELAALPAGYDATAHRNVEMQLEQLRDLEKQAAALTSIAESRTAREHEQAEARKRAAAAKRRLTRNQREVARLGWTEEEFVRTRSAFDSANEALRRAELHAVEATGAVQIAEESRRNALRELAQHRKREAAARELELELRHHNELDTALSRLRQDLNARVRPELSELASTFLAEITDGRYTAIEIDDDYNVLVLDEGEEKPVISGGEEDIANLVLRLAISQMIAERAGQQLSILILDEVFGSLDVEHRDAVVQLLHRLEGRFEQVILITHIESMREGLDNVIRVEYDERTGASRVREESASGALWTPQLVT